jgi:hypothetical protein
MKHETAYTRSIDELNAAQKYLLQPMIVFGRSEHDADLLKRLKMPTLPRLMSNRKERLKLINPCFFKRWLASATFKCIAMNKVFKRALKQEKQKQMVVYKFELQSLLQAPLQHEFVDDNPLTIEQFQQLCKQQ